MNVTDMEDRIDQAARRTAINLMRLNEALEHREADDTYRSIPHRKGPSARRHRHDLLAHYYRQWFTNVAREPAAAEEVTKRSGSQRQHEDTMIITVLECGHIEIRPGKCACTDCPNYVGDGH